MIGVMVVKDGVLSVIRATVIAVALFGVVSLGHGGTEADDRTDGPVALAAGVL